MLERRGHLLHFVLRQRGVTPFQLWRDLVEAARAKLGIRVSQARNDCLHNRQADIRLCQIRDKEFEAKVARSVERTLDILQDVRAPVLRKILQPPGGRCRVWLQVTV